MAKKLAKLVGSEKIMRKIYEVMIAKCQDMDQKLQDSMKRKNCWPSALTQQSLMTDDKKVLYYTGLPSCSVLRAVFPLEVKGFPGSCDNGIDNFDPFLMTLRLDAGEQDLACRFGVSQSTVSSSISEWVDILFTKLSFLIHWTERDHLMKTIPADFREHLGSVHSLLIVLKYLWNIQHPLKSEPRHFQTIKNTIL